VLIQQPIPTGVTQATGTGTVIAAPQSSPSDTTPKRIRVISAALTAAVAGTVTFQSHLTTANKSGAFTLAVGTPLVLPYNEGGWFWCTLGEALDLVVTGTSNTVSGTITYVTE